MNPPYAGKVKLTSQLAFAKASRKKQKTVAKTKKAAKPSDHEPSAKNDAGTSEVEVTDSHPNFGLGQRPLDSAGDLLLAWEDKAKMVSVSSLLPSWAVRSHFGEDAYALTYGLYGREYAAIYEKATL